MTRAEGSIYESPDDPYTVTTRWDDDGFHIVVSADVLAGGDTAEVEAEIRRRADLLRDHIASFLRPIGPKPDPDDECAT